MFIRGRELRTKISRISFALPIQFLLVYPLIILVVCDFPFSLAYCAPPSHTTWLLRIVLEIHSSFVSTRRESCSGRAEEKNTHMNDLRRDRASCREAKELFIYETISKIWQWIKKFLMIYLLFFKEVAESAARLNRITHSKNSEANIIKNPIIVMTQKPQWSEKASSNIGYIGIELKGEFR